MLGSGKLAVLHCSCLGITWVEIDSKVSPSAEYVADAVGGGDDDDAKEVGVMILHYDWWPPRTTPS